MVRYRNAEEIFNNKEALKENYLKSVSWAVRSKEVQESLVKILSQESAVLDIGCGGGHFLKILKDRGYENIYGFDIDNYVAFEDIKDRVRTGDLHFHKIDFEDKKFDIITAFQVMEHLENPFHFERECARLLRPGGFLVMSIPSGKSLWSRLSYFKSNNITGYDLVNDHISFLTSDVFEKTFLKDFEKEKEIYDRGFIPYLRGIKISPHRLLSKRVCYFLKRKSSF